MVCDQALRVPRSRGNNRAVSPPAMAATPPMCARVDLYARSQRPDLVVTIVQPTVTEEARLSRIPAQCLEEIG